MMDYANPETTTGRAPHGARGLKHGEVDKVKVAMSRAPHGARGLKLCRANVNLGLSPSRPAWGAWIETRREQTRISLTNVAPRMGRVD